MTVERASSGVHEYQDFYAICDHMPGATRSLRVGGTVVFRTSGWSARLERHQKAGPTGINPFILYVDLIITPPKGGTVTKALTPVQLDELPINEPELEYLEVQFVVLGADDDAPRPLEVEHPT